MTDAEAAGDPQHEGGFGEERSAMHCPMCNGELFNLYGLRCRRCGTRVVKISGREVTD